MSANTQIPGSSGRAVRVFVGLLLIGVAFGLGALSQRSLSPKPAPVAKKEAHKPTTPAPAPVPQKPPAEPKPSPPPQVNTVSIAGSVADEFGRALVDVMIFAGHDVPEAKAQAQDPAVGELGVIPGPVPAIPLDRAPSAPADAATARTDQDGKFSIQGLPSGSLQIFVSHAGYEPSLLVLEGLKPGETRDDLYLVLRTPLEAKLVDPVAEVEALAGNPEFARITGVVLDVLGRGVPNALVETDEGDATARTDASGAFRLVGVAEGVLHLVAEDESAGSAESAQIRARKGETLPDVRIHLPGRHVASPSDAEAPKTGSSILPPPKVPTAAPRPPKSSTPAPVLAGDFALEPRGSKLFVNLIDNGSAAAKAGLAVGDVLVSIDGEPVLSASQARGMLRDPAGEVAKVRVLRGKKQLTLRYKRPALRYAPGTRR